MTLGQSDPYLPIDCGIHDQLLAWATLRRQVIVTFKEANGDHARLEGVIADVFTRQKTEFLRLENGPEIRLDKIIDVGEA